MKPNIGTLDRSIRAIVGVALIAIFAFGLLPGISGAISLVAGIVLAATALIRRCPPYLLLGINTASRDD